MFSSLNAETKKMLTDASTVAGSITVTTAPVRILSYNTDRRLAIISNDSADTIYIGFSNLIDTGRGIRLNAHGGTFAFGLFTTFPWLGEVWAFSSFGASNVGFVEV